MFKCHLAASPDAVEGAFSSTLTITLLTLKLKRILLTRGIYIMVWTPLPLRKIKKTAFLLIDGRVRIP